MACFVCGSQEDPIFVHSHMQCRSCGSILEGCCEGASDCQPKETSRHDSRQSNNQSAAINHHHEVPQEWETT